MTAFDRFDPFERRIGDAIDEIAAARRPDYLDDVFRQTARSAQRPRWTFPERWLPVDTTLTRSGLARRIPMRPILVLVIIAALIVASLAFYIGSRAKLPAPFGPAANGSIAYMAGGDIYVRDSLTATPRLLIGGDGDQQLEAYSPDGTWLAYYTEHPDGYHFMAARADGSDARELALVPVAGNSQAAWSPDSRRIAFIYDVKSVPKLSIVTLSDTTTTAIDLGNLLPTAVSWSAPDGQVLLLRARTDATVITDLYTVQPDGSALRAFGLPGTSGFGTGYTLSGPTWAPDGGSIAFNSIEPSTGTLSSHFRIAVVAPDGSGFRDMPAPSDPKIQEGWPLYSPDGKWILVHRWVFKSDSPTAQGWLAIMPADGSAPAHDIGPRIDGGEDTGLIKSWSPDGSVVLMRSDGTQKSYSIDPVSGTFEQLTWSFELPLWQRVAR